MNLRIFGAGMSGLMAAQIMRRHRPIVFEAQTSLPDNHGALLRFRSNVVGKAVGQKLQRVEVQKAVMVGGVLFSDSVTLADANRYSLKVTGSAMGRSIINLSSGERYIAPSDFINQLANGVDIQYGQPLTGGMIECRDPDSEPIISTIPMPAMADMLGFGDSFVWSYRSIWSLRATILHPEVELYQTIYFPEQQGYYRASITGRQLIIEFAQEPDSNHISWIAEVLKAFGFPKMTAFGEPSIKFQKYGKLLPIDEEKRHAFILMLSDRYGIYSLGRFATWRQILLDDVVHDVEVIDNFITQRSKFARHRHWE